MNCVDSRAHQIRQDRSWLHLGGRGDEESGDGVDALSCPSCITTQGRLCSQLAESVPAAPGTNARLAGIFGGCWTRRAQPASQAVERRLCALGFVFKILLYKKFHRCSFLPGWCHAFLLLSLHANAGHAAAGRSAQKRPKAAGPLAHSQYRRSSVPDFCTILCTIFGKAVAISSSVSQVQDTVTPFSTSYRNVRDFQAESHVHFGRKY